VIPGPRTGAPTPGRPPRRPGVRALAVALALALAWLAAAAPPSTAQALPDAQPTWWQLAAGTAPLLTAPPPPNPATICIIDTGVTPTPDLDIAGRLALDGGTLDDVRGVPGHGTIVAHFAAGRVNGWGRAGAFPHARIVSVRVFPETGGNAAWQDYVEGIQECWEHPSEPEVALLALGGPSISAGEAERLDSRIKRARDVHNMSVVAAAGNVPYDVAFPGRFAASFTVAGGANGGPLCPSSGRGVEVDIVAPGCDLPHVARDGARWLFSGTSYAAPIVAGALAAVRTYAPHFSPGAAEEWLVRFGGAGEPPRLDAASALRALGMLPVEGAALAPTQHREAPTGSSVERPQAQRAERPGAEEVRVASSTSPAGLRPSPRRQAVRSLPLPRVRVSVTSTRRLRIVITNRPLTGIVQIRARSAVYSLRSLTRGSLRLAPGQRIGVRFVTPFRRSAWRAIVVRRAG